MSINFSAFEIGRRALNSNQFGISITGQNIANINTPGYSRKRVQMAEASTVNVSGHTLGTGVKVLGVEAFRDNLIQSRIQTETGIAGRLTSYRDSLSPVETALNSSDTGGLQNAISSFFGAFRDLDANPSSLSLRAVATQRGANLAGSFQSTRAKLDFIRTDVDGQLRSAVDQVNTLSSHIAKLNSDIRTVESSGGDASSLHDQQTELVNKLSDLAGVRQTQNADGSINLTIGEGRPLVTGDKAFTLQAVNTPPLGLASLTIDGQPVTIEEGRIRGFQDAMDEISSQITNLDNLAATVVDRVNTLHASGTDLDGNAGGKFFSDSPAVTAANISLDPTVKANPRLVVASALAQPGQNGTIAGEIANLMTDTNSTVGSQTGSFSGIYGSMLSDMGSKINSAENNLQTQTAIIAQATAQRDSVSGVSLDEEAINLLQYQKAFEAAARFIKVADEMTQTILSLAS
jgi:flagellar hook-associated protein 1 FlgK